MGKNEKGFTLRSAIEKTSQGIQIAEEDDVEPDSDKCVTISTRSSVKEMIAPGLYAVLAPIFVGFLVGARCLMGLLAGAIVSGAMLAVMMSNAGGAWDNSKKLCEKLKIKKTDQGKACVVGDTVGDPFKDTSGPSLDILLKLMSMVALMIAPLIDGNKDYEGWWVGLIPSVLLLGATAVLIHMGILSWKDPLADADLGGKQEPETPNSDKGKVEASKPDKIKAEDSNPDKTKVEASELRRAGTADAKEAWVVENQ